MNFKVLMHGISYVDYGRLEQGIYSTGIPHLFDKNETIENIINRAKQIVDMNGDSFVSSVFFENLSKCRLVKVSLIETN